METKDERRLRKLEMLIAGTEGGLDAIAIAAIVNPDYLKQIIKGVLLPPKKDGTRSARSLGDDAAEKIEDAYTLGRGWFDSDRPLPSGQLMTQEGSGLYNIDGWPFRSVTSKQYHQVLTQADRDTIESMAKTLVNARDSPLKQTPPAQNRAAA